MGTRNAEYDGTRFVWSDFPAEGAAYEAGRLSGDELGGIFNSITKKLGFNKKVEKQLSKKAGKPIKISFKNPTKKQLASGFLTSLKVGAAAASLAVPGLGVVGGAALVGGVAGVAAGADKLIAAAEKGGQLAKDAKKVYDKTKQLASAGDKDARAAMGVLSSVAAKRKADGVPKGAVMPLSASAKKAFNQFLRAPKLVAPKKAKAPTNPPKPVAVKPKAAPKPAAVAAAAAGEPGFFVNRQGRIRSGKFRSV